MPNRVPARSLAMHSDHRPLASHRVDRHPDLLTLSRFAVPFLCFDREGHPIHVSAEAERLLATESLAVSAQDIGVAVAAASTAGRTPVLGAGWETAEVLVLPALTARATCGLRWMASGGRCCGVVVLHPSAMGLGCTRVLDRLLSPREREVARLIASGRSTKEVARDLGISPHTARRHTERVFEKCGVRCRAALAALYVRALSEPA